MQDTEMFNLLTLSGAVLPTVRGKLSPLMNDELFTGKSVVSDNKMAAGQQDMCRQ